MTQQKLVTSPLFRLCFSVKLTISSLVILKQAQFKTDVLLGKAFISPERMLTGLFFGQANKSLLVGEIQPLGPLQSAVPRNVSYLGLLECIRRIL